MGRLPPTFFAWLDRPVNAVQLCRWLFSVHTKKLWSRLQVKFTFRWKTAILRFGASFGGLEATYTVHLRLIEKRTVDFLLVIIELFSLGVTAEMLRMIINWKSAFWMNGVSLAQNFRYKGSSLTNHSCQQTKRNNLSCGWECGHKFLSFCHNYTFDRQTNRNALAISCFAIHTIQW